MTPDALAEHLHSTRQAVFIHLKFPTDCRLLKQEKTCREIYYHFNRAKMKEIDKWLEIINQYWEDRLINLTRYY
ncbi:MAG: helix-turn-helix transcriptional regulator [Ferruginibacter sp.]